MSTGRKDRRITIETWTKTKGAGAGTSSTVASSYTMWADIEERDGRLITAQDQKQWPYNYKVKVRYEASRPISTLQTVLYQGVRMAINSVSRKREGMLWENILRCSTVSQVP